ncbi:MAG: ABC transporter permease subunit [Oscillospiraceae bacterium]|nr:ABC transporter permease subunit [Oscillospiraceae bacterium]
MKKYKSTLFKAIAWLCGGFVISATLFVFGYILYHGALNITWNFVFDRPRGVPIGTQGGVFPAVTGTVLLGALSGLIAGVLGSITTVFLAFYCRNKYLGGIIRAAVYLLSGMSSILFGLVGYSILLNILGLPRSLLAAGITVAVMILPYITIRVIKLFEEDSAEVLHASLALGVSKTYMLRKLILPNYSINILTSITLGVAYGIGAAAPVMLTGAVLNAPTPQHVTHPFMSLSYHLLILVSEGISLTNAYASAFLLMIILLALNLICRGLEYFKKRGG